MTWRKALSRDVAAILLFLAGVTPTLAQDPSGRCLECHSQQLIALLPVQFGDGQERSAHIDKEAFLSSAHGHLACSECHREYHPEFATDFVPSTAADSLPSRKEYALAIQRECWRCHGTNGMGHAKHVTETLHSQGDGTPVCTDCHSPHATQETATGLAINRRCAVCHEEVYQSLAASVHGASLNEVPNPDVPGCTTCHHGHEAGGKSLAAQRVRRGRPCMGCHQDEQLMGKYDVSTDVVSTYLNDFHGVSIEFYGDEASDTEGRALVCADCHGFHAVQPVAKAAVALQAGLREACQQCHEGATDNFTAAWLSHSAPSMSNNVLVFLVRLSYWLLIPFVITGLVLHILFHLVVLPIRTRLAARAAQRRGRAPLPSHTVSEVPANVPKFFVRFSRRQRAEHLLVLVTFGILLITGLPQKFHNYDWANQVVSLLGGIDSVRFGHRAAGCALAALAVLHLLIVSSFIVFQRAPMTMVPTRKDFEDSVRALQYYLGLADTYPRADRFDYGQKFEYWGMMLGTIVMVVSGFVLMYPMLVAQFFPGQLIAAARVAHSYEAMMALLTIVIWHMYGARFNPCIFTGKVSSKHLALHHPLEHERLVGQIHRGRRENSTEVSQPAAVVVTATAAELTRSC